MAAQTATYSPHQPALITVTLDTAPLEFERNQAPGIPDRRKSLRPSPGGRAKGSSRKSTGAARRLSSLVDMASEMRLKDDDDETTATTTTAHAEEKPVDEHPPKEHKDHDDNDDKADDNVDKADDNDDKADDNVDKADDNDDKADDKSNEHNDSDTFEDATSTPRAMSPEPDAHSGAVDEEAAKAYSNAADGAVTKAHSSAADEEDTKAHAGATAAEVTKASETPQGLGISDAGAEPEREARSRDDISPMSSPRQRSVSPGTATSRQGSPVQVAHGLSGEVAIPVQPPPSTAEHRQTLESNATPARSPSPPRPGFARKASNGFGALLGRMGSIRKPAKSPPAPRSRSARRGTAASISSTDGGSVSGQEGYKTSLQDQFSSLRKQEESVGSQVNGNGLHKLDEGGADDATARDGTPSPMSSSMEDGRVRSPTLDTKLPPGTASGMSAGPPPVAREVNWDLWQKLVYEGPSAVQKTSGEEMNAAITAGIPPAIRGVVWQVLADSKNEELEHIYRTLKARGTENDARSRSSRASSVSGAIALGTSAKDGVTSDASSEHSNTSPKLNSGLASPLSSHDSVPELQSKLLAEKQKREAAALQKLEKAIRRDMGSRTSYSKYTQSAGLQDGLFGVCKAYALFDEGVGYAQGINFIAMPLLFNMAEEEAFTLLVRLMSKYDIRSMFTPDMRGLHLRLYQFERLLEEYEPAVYCHLKRRHVEPQLYATQWFLTLFVYRFPLQLVLRIYDLILSEGLTAILKFGIVLIRQNRQALLNIKEMSQLTSFLKEKLFDVYIDKSPSASKLLDSGFFGSVTGGADKELYRADDMVRDACQIKIAEGTLQAYSMEWQEQQRVEREREAELENLRIANASLTARVKSLEERAQQHDTEHVTMAQDLVRIKVENDSLQDSNEALQTQVVELQKMIDAQPAEVESRLKAEMDRIMQRNSEVQNENRSLKEELDEMEHELVKAKMQSAQAQSDHDALKQKWQSVQAMLNDKK